MMRVEVGDEGASTLFIACLHFIRRVYTCFMCLCCFSTLVSFRISVPISTVLLHGQGLMLFMCNHDRVYSILQNNLREDFANVYLSTK